MKAFGGSMVSVGHCRQCRAVFWLGAVRWPVGRYNDVVGLGRCGGSVFYGRSLAV